MDPNNLIWTHAENCLKAIDPETQTCKYALDQGKNNGEICVVDNHVFMFSNCFEVKTWNLENMQNVNPAFQK